MADRSIALDTLLTDILAQPDAVRATVKGLLVESPESLRRLRTLADPRQRAFDLVVLAGMGSSYCALLLARHVLAQRGVACVAIETSELLHYESNLLNARSLLVAVSQSGESVEIVRLMDQIKSLPADRRPTCVSLTNTPASRLARESDLALPLAAGTEHGPATRTHTTSLAALVLIAAALAGEDPAQLAGPLDGAARAMDALLGGWEDNLRPLFDYLRDSTRPFLIGRGASQVSALAGALMLKEAGHIAAEGMSVGAFRHGPLELADPAMDMLVFNGDATSALLNWALVEELLSYGARVVWLGAEGTAPNGARAVVLPQVEAPLSPLVEVLVPQLWSRQLALAQGRIPGELRRLPKIIRVQ